MARSYNRIAASRRTGLPAAGLGTDSVTAAKIEASAVGTSEIADGTVAMADLANLAGLSVVGRSASTTGVPAAITGTDGQALRVSGTALGFGALATAGITDANVTYAKIANGTGLSVLGRSANTAGVNADIVGTDGQALRVSGTALGFGTIAAAGIATGACTGVKIPATAFKTFVATAADASGGAQVVTCTGTRVGDKVVCCFNATDLTDAAASFETVITVNDQIQQTATNLNTKKILVQVLTVT